MTRTLDLLDVTVLQPVDLAPLVYGRRLEHALLDFVVRFQQDTSDAAILLEMQRAGLDSIVSEDPDLRRAALDFDVYTWL